jgi:mRNA guanylyltransferase
MSVPEIPGLKADDGLATQFRREVAHLLGRNQTNFPGAQPVSFARHHLRELCQEEYAFLESNTLAHANVR